MTDTNQLNQIQILPETNSVNFKKDRSFRKWRSDKQVFHYYIVRVCLKPTKMATIKRKIITTDKAPIPVVPLSQAVQMDNVLYISGQLGMTTKGDLVDGFEAQTRLAFDNMGHILKAAGATFKNVSKMTVLLQDISQFSEMNKVYAEYFTAPYPARTAYQVAQLPKAGGLIEIEAIAVLGDIVDAE